MKSYICGHSAQIHSGAHERRAANLCAIRQRCTFSGKFVLCIAIVFFYVISLLRSRFDYESHSSTFSWLDVYRVNRYCIASGLVFIRFVIAFQWLSALTLYFLCVYFSLVLQSTRDKKKNGFKEFLVRFVEISFHSFCLRSSLTTTVSIEI